MTSKDKQPALWGMTVDTAEEEGVLVAAVAGRIGHVSAARLEAAIGELLAGGARVVAVDLERVDYMSSAGLIVLDNLAKRLETLNGRVMLCAPAEAVRLVLNLAGWGDRFAIAASRAEAVAVLQEHRRKPAGAQETAAGGQETPAGGRSC